MVWALGVSQASHCLPPSRKLRARCITPRYAPSSVPLPAAVISGRYARMFERQSLRLLGKHYPRGAVNNFTHSGVVVNTQNGYYRSSQMSRHIAELCPNAGEKAEYAQPFKASELGKVRAARLR